MVARFYVNRSSAPSASGMVNRGGWDAESLDSNGALPFTRLSTTTSTSEINDSSTMAYTSSNTAGGLKVKLGSHATPIVTTSGTLEGTITVPFVSFVATTAAYNHWFPRLYVWVSSGTGSTVRAVALDGYVSAVGISNTGRRRYIVTATLDPVSVVTGDRVWVETGFQTYAGSTNSEQIISSLGGPLPPDVTDFTTTNQTLLSAESQAVDFSDPNNVLGPVAVPERLRLYLNNEAPGYTPSANQNTWAQTASSFISRGMSTTPTGTQTSISSSVTLAQDTRALFYKFVSPPMTVAGTVPATAFIRGVFELMTGSTSNLATASYAYVTQGDSDTVRGVISGSVPGTSNTFPNTPSSLQGRPIFIRRSTKSPDAVTPFSVSVGDRIVIELGVEAASAVSAITVQTRYGGTSTTTAAPYISGGSGYVELPGFAQFFVSTGTTHSATGTAAGTSSAAGDADVPPPSGTTHNATGTATGTSSATGDLVQTDVVVGTSASTSSSTGTSLITSSVTSSTSGVSTSSGVAAVTRSATGLAAGVSLASGLSTLALASSGSATGASTATGSLLATRVAQGTATSSAGSTGTVTGGSGSNGQTDGSSTATGASLVTRAASGTAAGTSSSSGSLVKTTTGPGTAASTGSASGSASVTAAPVQAVVGTAAGSSSAIGTQARIVGLVGTSSSTSSTMSLTALVRLAAGTAPGLGSASGGMVVGIADRFVHRPSTGTVGRPDDSIVHRPVKVTL